MTTGTEPSEEEQIEEQGSVTDRLRKTLAAGFAFVRSREVTLSISSITFEEAISQAIADINEDESTIRPGKLTAVNNLKDKVVAAVDEARELPASAFFSTASTPANTHEDGSGPGESDDV